MLEAAVAFNLASGANLGTFLHHGTLSVIGQYEKRSNGGQCENGENSGKAIHSKTSSEKVTNQPLNCGHAVANPQFAFRKHGDLPKK
jgi:hypothetical protein